MKKLNCVTILALVLILSTQVFAVDFPLTNKRFALGAMSLCALNQTLQNKETLSVYVLGDEEVANELQIFYNQNIGGIKLVSIENGTDLPQVKPDVMIIIDDSNISELKDYCRTNNVLSISKSSFACQSGLSTAIVAMVPTTIEHEYSMTSVYAQINKKALFAEGMKFYPQLMKVAKPVEESNFENDLVMIQLF